MIAFLASERCSYNTIPRRHVWKCAAHYLDFDNKSWEKRCQ
jgi:hypothetical protein